MAFVVYNLVLLALSPAIAVYILYRIFISRKSRASWRQQLGFVRLSEALRGRDVVWVHAVSVGESVASARVVSELRKLAPQAAVIVSTTTQTGQEMAAKSVKDADQFIYYPFDLLPCVYLALKRMRPVVFASTDTEIWPNFRQVASWMGVRTAIINGTVSDKTLAGARRFPWIYRWVLSKIDRFCVQSHEDASRIVSIGADPARVLVTGNCKADQAESRLSDEEKTQVRSWTGFPDGVPVFVAGSTNPGEDGPVLDALLIARRAHPGLRLVIAPRQLERRGEVERMAAERGFKVGRRSDPSTITGAEDVVVLDTFGELAKVYSIADVSFVGGSLIPRGCHSILQPIAEGKPVFHGPYTFKARDLVAQAASAGVGFEVQDGEELGRKIAEMLSDPGRLADIAVRCERMMEQNRGASLRTAQALAELLSGSSKKAAKS